MLLFAIRRWLICCFFSPSLLLPLLLGWFFKNFKNFSWHCHSKHGESSLCCHSVHHDAGAASCCRRRRWLFNYFRRHHSLQATAPEMLPLSTICNAVSLPRHAVLYPAPWGRLISWHSRLLQKTAAAMPLLSTTLTLSVCITMQVLLPVALQFHLWPLRCDTVKLNHHAGAAPHGRSILITSSMRRNSTSLYRNVVTLHRRTCAASFCCCFVSLSLSPLAWCIVVFIYNCCFLFIMVVIVVVFVVLAVALPVCGCCIAAWLKLRKIACTMVGGHRM